MRRREFIAALGGTAVWPIAARAQQPMPVIGVLNPASPGPLQQQLAEMSRALKQAGFVDGQNLVLEYRWANGQYDRLPALAAELIARRVDMILALGASGAVVKAATQTIPIVAMFGGDPVAAGMVASLNRPGGNLTGVALLAFPLGPKRLEVLREALPGAKAIAVLANPTMAEALPYTKDVAAVARTLGQQIQILNASNDQELESAFAVMKQQGVGALLVMADPYFNVQRELIISLAARHSIPAIYEWETVHRTGRTDELRQQHHRRLSPSWHLRRQSAQGREAGRVARLSDGKGRACHQPQDRENARHRVPAHAARPRRRGDRITTPFAAARRDAIGTKADMRGCTAHVRF